MGLLHSIPKNFNPFIPNLSDLLVVNLHKIIASLIKMPDPFKLKVPSGSSSRKTGWVDKIGLVNCSAFNIKCS